MSVDLYRALVDAGVNDDKAAAFAKAMETERDSRRRDMEVVTREGAIIRIIGFMVIAVFVFPFLRDLLSGG